MDFKDYYKILGVDKNASDDDVRKAYRKLVRKYHPDVSKEADAQERMRDINEANDVLSDPEKRKAYDTLFDRAKSGNEQWASGDFQPPPGWDEGFTFHRRDNAAEEADFSDFFSSLFGSMRQGTHGRGAQQAQFKAHGEDQHAKVEIPLEDALKGAQRDITLRGLATNGQGHMQWEPRTLRVTIPAGTHQGQFIRLAGQGLPGQGGAPNGDLYLEVQIAPHPLYKVEGKDIDMVLELTPTEAALGAELQVPLPGGQKISMKIPPGTRGGSRLRVKGKGFPGNPPGDFYLNVQIVLPPADSETVKAAYRALAQAAPFNPRRF